MTSSLNLRIRYYICRSNSIPSEDDSVFLRDDINENDLPASREATAKEKTIISSIKGRFKTYFAKTFKSVHLNRFLLLKIGECAK